MANAALDHYGLSGLPFQITPDSQFFFLSSEHRRAISHLVYGLEQQEGFVVITGEIGAGKTTLMELLAGQLAEAEYQVARVLTTQLSAEDLLRLVGKGFGIAEVTDKVSLLGRIEERLRALKSESRRPLLIVDEAQGLSVAGLEELRMISNLSEGGRSLLQIVLLGQPEFRDTLAQPELNQLRQRILAFYHLGPISPDELRAYVEHRLASVGWTGVPRWEDAAFARIHEHTGGIPRRINRLCARVILHGGLERRAVIGAGMVDATAADLHADLGMADPFPAPAKLARSLGETPSLARLFEFLASDDPVEG